MFHFGQTRAIYERLITRGQILYSIQDIIQDLIVLCVILSPNIYFTI